MPLCFGNRKETGRGKRRHELIELVRGECKGLKIKEKVKAVKVIDKEHEQLKSN